MSHRPDLVEHLIAATRFTLARQERLAHAEFYFGNITEASREAIAAEGTRPWRGLMSPDMLSIINILEEMGRYEPPELAVPSRAA